MKGLFVGISTVDIQLYVSEYPESNTKNRTKSTRVDIGGPATNAAVTFTLLGGDARLITQIGQQEFRDYMLNKFVEHRINVMDISDNVVRDPNFSVIITSLDGGERTIFAPNIMGEQGVLGKMISEDFDICLVDGFLAETVNRITTMAKDSGKITVLDGGSWKTGMEKYLKNIDYAVCSSDFYPPGCRNLNEIIGFLHENGIINIAFTRGEKSILAFENGRKTEIKVKSVDAVDTSGAGDVFHGAFCYSLLRDNNFVTALEMASGIAAESCKYYGTREWSSKMDKF